LGLGKVDEIKFKLSISPGMVIIEEEGERVGPKIFYTKPFLATALF